MKNNESMEMYLETIYLLVKSGKKVHSIDVANAMGYSKPSISRAMRLLEKDNYISIVSRKEAIKKGISMLKEKDILLILGKGHEDYQIIGSDEFPFKDSKEVMKIIK